MMFYFDDANIQKIPKHVMFIVLYSIRESEYFVFLLKCPFLVIILYPRIYLIVFSNK